MLRGQTLSLAFPSLALLLSVCYAPRSNPSAVTSAATKTLDFPTVLYGAAYYNEYMPQDMPDAQDVRLEKDVALMKAAGLNVVRMGESTWSLWEPEDGHFEYAWMDRIVDAMGKAGIKVILGTPTYSLPRVDGPPASGDSCRSNRPVAPFGGKAGAKHLRLAPEHGHRLARLSLLCRASHPPHRRALQRQPHCHRLAARQRNRRSYDAANPDVFIGFQHYLEKKFGTPEALSKAWFLNYWGENIHTWEDLPTRDGTISPATSSSGPAGARCASPTSCTGSPCWCASAPGPGQFVTTDYGGMMKRDVNEEDVAKSLDIVADNIYHGTQDHYDGSFQSLQSDFSRSLKHQNFLVTETNAQTIGWTSQSQYPPYDGQLREDVYTYLANGANMVEYWHWASIAANQETYWKGILSHDLEPNRAYAEVSRTAHELQKIGPHLVGLKIHNDVAILVEPRLGQCDQLHALWRRRPC